MGVITKLQASPRTHSMENRNLDLGTHMTYHFSLAGISSFFRISSGVQVVVQTQEDTVTAQRSQATTLLGLCLKYTCWSGLLSPSTPLASGISKVIRNSPWS